MSIGMLIAKHRKVHLLDIDSPDVNVSRHVHPEPWAIMWLGFFTYAHKQESDSLTGGNTLTTFETPFGMIGLGIRYDIVCQQLSINKATW